MKPKTEAPTSETITNFNSSQPSEPTEFNASDLLSSEAGDTTCEFDAKNKSNAKSRRHAISDDSEEEYEDEGDDDFELDDSEKFTKSKPKSNIVEPKLELADEGEKIAKYEMSSTYKSERHAPPPRKKIKVEVEERYAWLLDLKDANKNPVDSPNYDPRTLFIPSSAWAKFTPFEKQYWEIKQNLFNTVVFFKKGKFYELYENDAYTAHKLFDLKLAGGGRANMALCGVPEMSFDYWAGAFIAKGFKVAKVDQAETAIGKEMRDQKALQSGTKKEEKIIKRELKCVLTAGTLTDSAMIFGDLSQFCLCLKQENLHFSACFVDTATSQFFLADFTDKSSDYPMLETLLAQIRPRELVTCRNNLDRFALKILRNNTAADTLWEVLNPKEEFWDSDTARLELDFSMYFPNGNVPTVLEQAMQSDLAASVIGGLVSYLRTLKLDQQLLGLGQFCSYDASAATFGTTLVLDGHTLQNLEVFANTWDGGADGTLFKLVNKCITPFGKRRLRAWLAHPLQLISSISSRADAVDCLIDQIDVSKALQTRLTNLPDIERMLSRVHANTLKPKDFYKLVTGLETCAKTLAWLAEISADLKQLNPFINLSGRSVADLLEVIEPWMSAFDHVAAKDLNKLVPEKGVDEEFDITLQACQETEKELKELLQTYKKLLGCKDLEFRDSGKEIYLVEVPIKYAKKVPSDWTQMGATSKCKRFYSPELRKLVRQLQEAQELHNMASAECQQKVYKQFCTPDNYKLFMEGAETVAVIDCLLSLALTSQSMIVHCRPEFVDPEFGSFMEFKELRHPTASSTDFIPNDICLGKNESRMSLLTGANAAGKSTVLRTTGCAVLLAQLGCHVPAREAKLTPVDRIMTRLGASDNIFAGKSTFHVELAETERILSEGTSRSFVVLDELGRGGSSSDGFAIAESVLHHLATHVNCLGFFATHYATLYDSFTMHPQVKPERMAILVNKDTREVTFLYTLEPGRSEGSFGMNVALMCGVDPEIVANAEIAANKYEQTSAAAKLPTMPLGLLSDVNWMKRNSVSDLAMDSILEMARKL